MFEKNADKKNSALIENGRYVAGGTVEVSTWGSLEWWEKRTMTRDITDLVYVVEKKFEGRPDLIANAFYGDTIQNPTGLNWFVCQYNAILDPFEEITEGVMLRLPHPKRLMAWLRDGSDLGGVPSTR